MWSILDDYISKKVLKIFCETDISMKTYKNCFQSSLSIFTSCLAFSCTFLSNLQPLHLSDNAFFYTIEKTIDIQYTYKTKVDNMVIVFYRTSSYGWMPVIKQQYSVKEIFECRIIFYWSYLYTILGRQVYPWEQ